MGWGSSTRRGGGRNVRALSLESLSSLGFEGRNLGCPRIFAGMSRTSEGCSKSLCTKKFVRIFHSLAKGGGTKGRI